MLTLLKCNVWFLTVMFFIFCSRVHGKEHCHDGDHVCKLIELHTNGMLTHESLSNVSRNLDLTLHRALGLEMNVHTLNTKLEQDQTLSSELRLRLENEAQNREKDIKRVEEEMLKTEDKTKSLKQALLTAETNAKIAREEVRGDFTNELSKIKKTISREAKKQTEFRQKIAKLKALKAKWEVDREKLHAEEQREKKREEELREERRENRTRQLSQETIDYEDEKARSREEKRIELEEISALRKEEEHRKTEEALQANRIKADLEMAQMKQNTAAIKAKAEAEGRILQERQNKDIHMERLMEEGNLAKQKVLDAINLLFVRISEGANALISDPQRIGRLLLSLVALAAGIYVVRDFSRVAAEEVAKRLGKPSLIRETSREIGIWGTIVNVLKQSALAITHCVKTGELGVPEDMTLFSDVILSDSLRSRVEELARSTRYARKNRAPYRHVLFYGPAGTGKSMVAKRMALFSGMDWAIMTGGDVGPLGAQAVTDLHKIFKWAKSSSRGLVLFIDEAEAFLGSRSRSNLTEHTRNALNALLYQTGDQSEHFILILATNRPSDLDTAILDRVDEAIFFDIPGETERIRLAHQYFDEHLLKRMSRPVINTCDQARRMAYNMAVSTGMVSRPICVEGFADLKRVTEVSNRLYQSVGMDTPAPSTQKTKILQDTRVHDSRGDNQVNPSWGVRELKVKLGEHGLDNKGRKADLQKRLQVYYERVQTTSPSETYASSEEEIIDDADMADEHAPPYMTQVSNTGVAQCMESIGRTTVSFSGRQIAKLMISVQGAVYGTNNAIMTPELLQEITTRKIAENKRKREMAHESRQTALHDDNERDAKRKKEQHNYC